MSDIEVDDYGSVLAEIEKKLIATEEELRASLGAAKATQMLGEELENFILSNRNQLIEEARNGTMSQESANAVIKWMTKMKQQFSEKASKILASHELRRGEVEALRWTMSVLVGHIKDEVPETANVEIPPPAPEEMSPVRSSHRRRKDQRQAPST